ncbi:CHAP domain-containing protein [Bifidobacterium sp. SO4]|uniref:CHAP domain-containing protein n=1 Tax=Bifidobacterium sp. SO4 TaxID=2809030 RepID=UPI003204881E
MAGTTEEGIGSAVRFAGHGERHANAGPASDMTGAETGMSPHAGRSGLARFGKSEVPASGGSGRPMPSISGGVRAMASHGEFGVSHVQVGGRNLAGAVGRRGAKTGARGTASRGVRQISGMAGKVSGGLSRLGRAAAEMGRRMTAALISSVGGMVGVPMLVLVAGLVAVIAMMGTLLAWLPGFESSSDCEEDRGDCVAWGETVGSLDPVLAMRGNGTVDVEAMDLPPITSYERWQCTWWAAARREQIGKPVDPWMGDGHMWSGSAQRFGYPMDKSPRPGDVMVFQKGVLGADPTYGHVAVVEEVREDGSIVISESGVGFGIVALREFTAETLRDHRVGIDFIH